MTLDEIVLSIWDTHVKPSMLESLEGPDLEPFGPPIEIPEHWRSKRIVKLNVAILAIHLLAARAAFKGLPEILTGQIQELKSFLANHSMRWFQTSVLTAAEGYFFTQMIRWGHFFRGVEIYRNVEKKIRDGAFLIKRELVENRLEWERKRTEQEVRTRHV